MNQWFDSKGTQSLPIHASETDKGSTKYENKQMTVDIYLNFSYILEK